TRRTHIVFSIWVVIILALPIWWRTTEVYRAPLPFEAIRSWETTQITATQDTSRLLFQLMQKSADRKSMRVVKYAPAYQVVLSLLVGDPESVMVSWDAQAAASAYIQPFLFELNAISEFTISSQILNYASLPIQPEKGQDGNGNTAYYMNVKALSNFLNSAEWNLASVVSSASPINLILYIPPMEQTPLHVLHYNGINSFLIPQWGGVVIRNVPNEFRQIHYNLEKLHPIMEIFVEQLRGLLGIDSVCIVNEKMLLPNVRVEYGDASEIGMTRWELDRLIRSRTVQNMANAAQTLISLANLLERLSGMVVLDLIKYYVTDSLNYLNMTKHELSTCQFTNAAQYARRAVTSAEAAFFDPTMVPLLYFPDEHKFAIYMPYFVPVTVPLILALFREVRLWISKKREAKLKSKTE
ncbi:hypothetical protein BATDEDRAFT_7967, partial [Batrachochytrium dendrobatidis JAM81]